MIDGKMTGGQIVFRRMQLEDIPQVYAIDQASFTLPWSERSFHFEVSENPNARPWVAEQIKDSGEKQIVAMLVIWSILDEAHVATIAVHPDCRRQHLATRLLAHALLPMLAEGARIVYLEVRKSNQAAQALYRNFGFEEVGIRPRYYQDNHEDAVLMTLYDPQSDTLKRFAMDQEIV